MTSVFQARIQSFRRERLVRRLTACVQYSAILCGVCLLAGAPLLAAGSAKPKGEPAAKTGAPWLRLKFEDLGVPGVSLGFLNAGSSLMTVHFLDSSHLLLTFGSRALVPRIPDDPITDDDRMVAAEIVELPSGKVLARTDWHLHDHGRYLWKLGNGRFLLRAGGALSLIAPLDRLQSKDPFKPDTVGYFNQRPSNVHVSPDGAIVTVETDLKPQREVAASSLVSYGDAMPQENKVMAAFYRVSDADGGKMPVKFSPAAVVRANSGFILPADGDGYLNAVEKGHGQWAIRFEEFGGKEVPLAELMSSCSPSMTLASRSEFLALTCRGIGDQLKLSSYGFDGHENWEEPFGTFSSLSFAFAPGAGRFAMSRINAASSAPVGFVSDGVVSPEQELRVYQTESGDLLLKVKTAPAFRTAENFDLSPDGMFATVIQDHAIEVYRLPELTKRDRDDIAEVNKLVPPATTAFSIAKIAHPIETVASQPEAPAPTAASSPSDGAARTTAAASSEPAAAGPAIPSQAAAAAPSAVAASESPAKPSSGQAAAAISDGAAPAAPAQPSEASGDASGVRRQPPTLLRPGETAENSHRPSKPE